MSLAVSYINSPEFPGFQWQGSPYLAVISGDITPETVNNLQREFPNWAILSGLREANEYFDAFLDEVFTAALLIENWSEKRIANERNAKSLARAKQFESKGTEDKLKELHARYGIASTFAEEMISIRYARNCLTHRLGIVGWKDVRESTGLTISWRVSQLYGYEPDGSEFIPEQGKFPMVMPVGSPLMMRWIQQSRTYQIGERVELLPQDLQEICFTFSLTVSEIIESLTTYAETKGVIVNKIDVKGNESPN